MSYVFRLVTIYAPLVYISLLIVGLFVFRQMWRGWREWRDAVYSLEREFAIWRLARITGLGLLVVGSLFGEFYISTFVTPLLPATDLLITPTLDLLASPQPTLFPVDSALTPLPTQPVQSGMTGCVKDHMIITAPSPGDTISGVVDVAGTADIPNLGFYKYEVASAGTDAWQTIGADRKQVDNDSLGKFNTLSVNNGDYFLRLVVTDNVGNALPPCVIAVRVLNQ
jgi:hypothetical protein